MNGDGIVKWSINVIEKYPNMCYVKNNNLFCRCSLDL